MLSETIRFCLSKIPVVLATIVCTFIGIELLNRSKVLLPVVAYKADDHIPLLEPNQDTVLYLANYSYRSLPFSTNSESLRGKREIDWNKQVICVVGSSEVFGCGIKDDETSSEVLRSELLAAGEAWQDYDVANLGQMGFGPYAQSVLLKRMLDKHAQSVKLIIVRVAIGDRNSLPQEMSGRSAILQVLYDNVASAPFFLRKAKAFALGLQRAASFRSNETEDVDEVARANKMWERHHEYWEAMAQLAAERDIKIIFDVYEPLNDESPSSLTRNLQKLESEFENAHVAELNCEDFGLQGHDRQSRTAEYNNRFTLRCDPHANKKQHRLLGEIMAKQVQEVLTP